MDTEVLINRLAAGAEPVRRLTPAWRRASAWLVLGLPVVVVAVALHGFAVDSATLMADRRLWIEQVATLATALSAAYAALSSTVPGEDRRWQLLPVLPFTVWLATVGEGCLADWRELGAEAFTLRLDTGCFLPMVLMGIVPAIALLAMLRRGAPLAPRTTLFLGTFAVAAFVNLGLRFFHVGDVSVMILVWHFGLVAVLTAMAGWAGPRLLGWRSVR